MSATLLTSPPLPRYWQQQQVQASPTPDPCACVKGAALTVQQGATLSTQLTLTVTDKITGIKSPVDVTGTIFQFTAKVDPSYPDSDPSTVMIDWQETSTPTQGITWLVVPAATTANMQLIAYAIQIWMVSASGVVTPLVQGTLSVTESISARAAGPVVNPL